MTVHSQLATKEREAEPLFSILEGLSFCIETYGCQMNVSDSEIVAGLLERHHMKPTSNPANADWLLVNTCSIRDKAEQTARNRILHYRALKHHKPQVFVGVLGCMAARLKKNLLDEERIIDLVAGPDSYRMLPRLMTRAMEGEKAVNTFLSKEETYDDLAPVRYNSRGVSAFLSIMRGCDNMCSFCVVPFTRGRERSRSPMSLIQECREVVQRGYKEVTLLGQNVDSYLWSEQENNKKLLSKRKDLSEHTSFAQLLAQLAQTFPQLRIRFSTSHPRDITREVLRVMKRYPNIAKHIHLPAQSGSSAVLARMRRDYAREGYLEKVRDIRQILGADCAISSDIITGFCGETSQEHEETLSLMERVRYDHAFMFAYSERPGTLAQRKYRDDVPQEVKKERLQDIIQLQQKHAFERNQQDLGKTCEVLVEGESKRSDTHWQGRNSQNKVVVFPKRRDAVGVGAWVEVRIEDCTPATLLGVQVGVQVG